MKRYILSLALLLSMSPILAIKPWANGGCLSQHLPDEMHGYILSFLDMKSFLSYITASGTLHNRWMQEAPLLKNLLKHYLRKNNEKVHDVF